MTGLNNVQLGQLRGHGDSSQPRLFFVVPAEARRNGYAKGQPVKTSASGDARQAGEAGRTKQFALLLDLTRHD